ncbi:MAG: hypothetical protein ACK5U8_11085 [Deltaproteobacteria bacterium]
MTALPAMTARPITTDRRAVTMAWVAITAVGASLALALAGCPSRGVPSYDPCRSGEACEDGPSRCIEIVYPGPSGEGVGSMCTLQGCARDADCPFDPRGERGRCLLFAGAPSTCFEACARAGDCALGWSCQALAPAGGGTLSVCVPAAP